MILIYAFVAFLFYKIMPVFMDMPDNTVLGAAVMAIASGLIIVVGQAFIITLARPWALGIELSEGPVPFPFFAYAIYAGIVLATVVSGFMIAAGFADGLFQWAWGSRGLHEDSYWLALVLAIPPVAHSFFPLLEVHMMGRVAASNRRLTHSLK